MKVTELIESAGIYLARRDLEYGEKLGIEVFVQGDKETKEVYMTAGCMIPFSEDNFLDQIDNAAEFQSYATSGSILHHFVEDDIEPIKLSKYIKKLFEKPIVYITLTPTMTTCMNCGTKLIAEDGVNKVCPKCGSDDLAVFSRVIGYYKMISRKGLKITEDGKYEGEYNFWNNSKRRDWATRRRFREIDMEIGD